MQMKFGDEKNIDDQIPISNDCKDPDQLLHATLHLDGFIVSTLIFFVLSQYRDVVFVESPVNSIVKRIYLGRCSHRTSLGWSIIFEAKSDISK